MKQCPCDDNRNLICFDCWQAGKRLPEGSPAYVPKMNDVTLFKFDPKLWRECDIT